MSSSEEEDYMSDAFLSKLTAEDVRPGLPMSRTMARMNEIEAKKHQNDQKHRETHKSVKILEEERREEGLNTAISSDSKGFAMLAKLGYKPGESLGRSTVGISEPIKVQVKTNRGGLGKHSAQEQLKKLEDWSVISSDFVQRIAGKRKEKETMSTLCKCQKVCQSLDIAAGIESPEENWYWPLTAEQPTTDSDEEQREGSDESEYDSDSDLSNRSGEKDSDDDHIDRVLRKRKKKQLNDVKSAEIETKADLNIEAQANVLLNRLRTKYFYCIWCGIQYDDESDLNNKCPGVEKDDH